MYSSHDVGAVGLVFVLDVLEDELPDSDDERQPYAVLHRMPQSIHEVQHSLLQDVMPLYQRHQQLYSFIQPIHPFHSQGSGKLGSIPFISSRQLKIEDTATRTPSS
ncbi:unnamed protein product [Calypogeia fissa]